MTIDCILFAFVCNSFPSQPITNPQQYPHLGNPVLDVGFNEDILNMCPH